MLYGYVTVEKGVERNINAILADNCGVMIKKGTENSLVQKVNIEQQIEAPVFSNQKIGSVTYEIDGKEIKTVDIISDKEVKKESMVNVASFIFKKWFCLLR